MRVIAAAALILALGLAGCVADDTIEITPVPGVPYRTTQAPNASDFRRVYPAAAKERGIAGDVTLHCVVAADGRLAGCWTSGETPRGEGFGAAALALATTIREASTIPGKSITGTSIDIPIHFRVD